MSRPSLSRRGVLGASLAATAAAVPAVASTRTTPQSDACLWMCWPATGRQNAPSSLWSQRLNHL
nr:twin-arginine translocation signal domain-containing protein [Acetobacter persici]